MDCEHIDPLLAAGRLDDAEVERHLAALQLHCPITGPAHLLLGHAPLIALAAASAPLLRGAALNRAA